MKSAVAAGPSAPLTAVAATGGHIRITNSPWRATNKVSAAGSGGMSGDKKNMLPSPGRLITTHWGVLIEGGYRHIQIAL